MNPKNMTADQISKFVKAGNVEQLEIAVLMGKGKLILGKQHGMMRPEIISKVFQITLKMLKNYSNMPEMEMLRNLKKLSKRTRNTFLLEIAKEGRLCIWLRKTDMQPL